MQTIYIEYIFINNLAINYLVCYLALLTQRVQQSIARVLLASVIGAVFASIYPFVTEFKIIIKILLSFAMVLTIINNPTIKDFAITLLLFYTISFIFAGAGLLLADYINDKSLLPFAVCGGVVLSVGMIRLSVSYFYQRKKSALFEYSLDVYKSDGKTIEAVGYYDSGNKLMGTDNQPAVVISNRLADNLSLQECGELAVNTVAGVKVMKLVNLNFKIYYSKHQHKIYHSQAIVSDSLNNKNYQVILHRDMGGQNE